jgi:uncharacterized protein YjbJ (UPF0337 family)
LSYFEFPLESKQFDKEEIMPDKSGRKGKNEGTVDKAKGRVKKATGSLTGNKVRKAEGWADQDVKARSRKRRAPQMTC